MNNDAFVKDLQELVDVLNNLDRDELLQTYGFALGLKAKHETDSQPG